MCLGMVFGDRSATRTDSKKSRTQANPLVRRFDHVYFAMARPIDFMSALSPPPAVQRLVWEWGELSAYPATHSHPGPLSNSCSIKQGPLEPTELLCSQEYPCKLGASIQTGSPGEIILEPGNDSSRVARSRAAENYDDPRSEIDGKARRLRGYWFTVAP